MDYLDGLYLSYLVLKSEDAFSFVVRRGDLKEGQRWHFAATLQTDEVPWHRNVGNF